MRKLFIIIFFVVLGFLPLLSFFHHGLPLTQDGKDQVARIANFYTDLSYGIVVPRWAANLNWGYGHPILEFLYPLPSYAASLMHFLGFSFISSAKIVFVSGMFFSFLFMYLWLSSFLDILPSLLGALLYLYAPYRFIDIYVRGDIGENLAFVFMPLLLYFLFKLYKKRKQYYRYVILGSLSLCALILSHNASSLMFLTFIVFYCIYLILILKGKERKKLLFSFLWVFILGFLLSCFFWIPGLLEAKYTLRSIVIKGGYLGRFVSFQSLIYGLWNYGQSGQFTVQVGIAGLISFIGSFFALFFLKKEKDQKVILLLGLILYFIFSVFLMLPLSNFIWSRVTMLQDFQFPWRFLTVTVFALSVISALFLSVFKGKVRIVLFIALCLIAVFATVKDWHPKGYLHKDNSFFSGVYNGTTDTGESAPVWSVRFMEKRPKAYMQLISGKALIMPGKRTPVYHKYVIKALSSSRILENTLYFPGWKVLVDGSSVPLQFQDPNFRGLMTFTVSSGIHIVQVKFSETKLRLFSDILSLLSLICVVFFSVYFFIKKKL